MSHNNNKPRAKRKPLGIRILVITIAALMIVGFAAIPLRSRAEEAGESITVQSFETGKLSDALSEAANGTDYNFIKNVAVLSGTLNAAD